MNYGELLRDPRWQRRRLEILERDGWRCRHCCEDKRELQVHHKRYGAGAPWEVPPEWLVTLCDLCHARVTEMRKQLNEIVSGMTAEQVMGVIAMVYASDACGGPVPVVQVIAEYCERQRAIILAQPFSAVLSRLLEAVDELQSSATIAPGRN